MRSSQRGSASIELAFSIPFLMFFFLLMVQVGIVMLDQLAVTQAAREAARAAAVSPSQGVAAAAARSSTLLDGQRMTIDLASTGQRDGLVRVSVTYKSRVVVPFSNRTLMEPVMKAQAAMALEKP